jgi:hypothetical protein
MPYYPKSWPMTVAFAQLPFEKYDEFRGIAFLAIFHVAILAIFFDLIKLVLERESGISQKLSFVISWLIILFLISIEASWELLPPSLLIERAVMYWSIGLFTLGFFAWYSKNSQMQYLMSMGIILASAMGLKTPTMSLAIPAALIGLLYWKSQFSEAQSSVSKISLIKIAACLLLPLAIILTMWISHTSQQSIKVGLDINFDETFIERFFNLSALLKEAFTNYLVSFKSPLTGAGIIGLITALWFPNQRGVAIALLTYIVLSWLGMWPLYLFSIGGNEHEALPSFQRYVRVPIRLIHYFGAALFLINIFTFLKLREYPFIKVIFRAKYLFRASGILIVLLGGFQIWSINRSYLDMEFRIFGSTTSAPHRAAKIRSFKAQSERLNTLIKELRLATPSTLLISQNGDGFVQRMAHYYSISDSKHSKLFNYKLISQWSWGPVSNNMWMRKTTVEDFGKFVAAKDIIWPYKLDSWTTNILLNFIDNEKCRENISDYFLIKQKNKFQCFANFSR